MQSTEAYKMIGDFKPYQYQKELWDLLAGEESEHITGVTLFSGTGSGKTEAVLLPALFCNKRLVMVYPTKSLIEDQIGRINEYVRTGLERGEFAEKTVIIDVGDKKEALRIKLYDETRDLIRIRNKLLFLYKKTDRNGNSLLKQVTINGEKIEDPLPDVVISKIADRIKTLKNFEIAVSVSRYSEIKINETANGPFIAYKEKRHYYGGDVILTSLDEFLFRFFGYGGKHNLLYPYRLIWSSKAGKDLVVAFDEAHSYEDTAYTNFISLLSSLVSQGIKVVVMSATLPREFISLTEKKFGFRFIEGEERGGKKKYKLIEAVSQDRNSNILQILEDSLRKSNTRRNIIVRNTVRGSSDIFGKIASYDKEKKLYEFDGIPVYFYHGRLFPSNRNSVYKELKKRDKEGAPYILITTHAIEVGCDLDCELMITDFCNPEQLIQRAGRCARKLDSEGMLYVIGTELTEEEEFLRRPEAQYEKYVEILRENQESYLPQDQIKEILIPSLQREELSDALFSFLSEYVYSFDRKREELHNSGFVITRSWVPSAKLFWIRDLEIAELKKLFKKYDLTGVIEYLKRNRFTYSFDHLSVSLESLSSNEVKKTLKDQILVVAISNSGILDEDSGEERIIYYKINPYVDDIFVFFKSKDFPNNNPLGAGLVSVPKIFQKTHKDLIVKLEVPSQFLPDKNRRMSMEYLAFM